jgi:hypothetical protein
VTQPVGASRVKLIAFLIEILVTFILIEREDAVCKFVHRDYSATPDVKCHIGSVSATLAIRADNHSRLFATAGAVITAVSCAY